MVFNLQDPRKASSWPLHSARPGQPDGIRTVVGLGDRVQLPAISPIQRYIRRRSSMRRRRADVLIPGGSPASWNYIKVLSDDIYRVAGSIHREQKCPGISSTFAAIEAGSV